LPVKDTIACVAVAAGLALFAACSGSGNTAMDVGNDMAADVAADTAADTGGDTAGDVAADLPIDADRDAAGEVPVDTGPEGPGVCRYQGPATGADECKEYGDGWEPEAARDDCAAVLPGISGVWSAGPCPDENVLGTCDLAAEGGPSHRLVISGEDLARCNLTRAFCLVALGGTFQPGTPCQAIGSPTAAWGSVPFVPAYRMCVPPPDGEASGQTEGHVCTWTLISGCTEDGLRFEDYGYCPDVMTNRPFSSVTAPTTDLEDPRLQDAEYMAEVAWAARQVEACGCVCCHKKTLAPRGPAGWYIDAPGIWLDGLEDSGLALFVGLADSRALGAFDPADNNNFNRTDVGIPTTDVARMKALLEGEMVRRGLSEEDARAVPPFGGPLVEQFTYVPEPCVSGEGVAADGTIDWGGYDVRYLYILEGDASAPVVPPNLDLPEGTLWRIDVPNVSPPFTTAIYGQVSGDQRQVVPATGLPEPLESGKTYYIYALIDIGLPATRCLFIAP
jgi:hypothetical protein